MAKILITGATGFIGRYLCDALDKDGHDIKILVRKGKNYTTFPVNLENIISVDWPYGINENISKNIDIIIHCANSPESRNRQMAYDANVLSTQFLCKAAEKSKSSLIFISSQSANKNINSLYAETKLASEEFIKNNFNGTWIILRPGMVYGSGSSGLFSKMQNVVEKFPLVPLINGGNQTIQPIHVLDLVKIIALIAKNPKKHGNKIYYLGDSKGILLKDFLKISANSKRKMFFNIPAKLIIPFINFGNKIVPLPITESNIKGLINMNKMDSTNSLRELRINLRELNKENIYNKKNLKSYKALRTILVGAGKMGTIHFLNLKQIPELNLVGVVEKNKNKAKLLTSFDDKTRTFSGIKEASKELKPDLAIICTPTFTHLEVLKECLEENMHCFIEKPLGISPEENLKIQNMVKKYPGLRVSVGYLTSHYKHIKNLKKKLDENKFGKIKKINAVYYLSHIMGQSDKGWETKKKLAGGGVILNAGIHTLNTLSFLFGTNYKILNKKTYKIYSKEVEDKLEAEIIINGKKISLEFDWSKQGNPTATNFIKILTDKGEIIVDNIGFMFKPKKGKKEFMFSDMEEIRFNLSPEQGASGFLTELENFRDSLIKNNSISTDINWATKIEKLAHDLSI